MANASKNKRRGAAPPRGRDSRSNLVAGRLDMHRDGYGFVRVTGGDRENDLFIPPNELNGAMQGDEVLVEEAPPGRDGRRSGRIARVMTRSNPTIVGIFHYARPHRRGEEFLLRGNYITPLDERLGVPVLIPDGEEIPPAHAATQDRTLGEEATAQQQDWFAPERGLHPLEGLAVDVEIMAFPTPGRPARGRVVEILGPPDAFGVDVEIIIRKHRLPHTFPQNVLREADTEAQKDPAVEGNERRDFRHERIVTIDGETAKDFDDAVLVRPLSNGNTELQVHIADVSHYVRPQTALDLEARLRGTSVYFPDRAVPMLPPALSSGLCSLRPDEDRLVLSCIMQIDPRGEISGYEVCEGIIRSAARLTYTVVQAVLDDRNPAEVPNYEHHDWTTLTPEIKQMHALALTLNAKRRRRGSIDFDLPEPVIQFDSEGNMASVVRSERGWSHRLIEEFMLSANECIAHWLEAQGIPSIYRVHETPDPKRIADFEDTAAHFGYTLGFANLPVRKVTMKADRRESRSRNERGSSGRSSSNSRPQQHEVPESIPITPQMYQRLTAKIEGKPGERILAYLMLRSLKQARYSEQNFGHFALASPSYTHFTSPIRRYPDLIVHRLLRAMLQGGADPHGAPILSTEPQPWGAHATPIPSARGRGASWEPLPFEELANIAAESSLSERRADDAERELIEWKKIKFMQDRVGEDFNAIILSVTKYGFFVELDDLFVEGLVPLSSLDTPYQHRRGGFRGHPDEGRFTYRDADRVILHSRTGQSFRMGQRVHVLLDRIDRQQRRLQFALVPEPSYSPDRSGKPNKKEKRKKRR